MNNLMNSIRLEGKKELEKVVKSIEAGNMDTINFYITDLRRQQLKDGKITLEKVQQIAIRKATKEIEKRTAKKMDQVKNIYATIENMEDINIIVQTNTDLFDFREAITDNYIIEDEIVVKEKGIYYVIMKLKKGYKNYKYEDYIVGPIIKQKDEYLEYRKFLLQKYTDIYNNIPASNINKKLEFRLIVKSIKKYC